MLIRLQKALIDEMAASIGDLAKSVETAKTAVELQRDS